MIVTQVSAMTHANLAQAQSRSDDGHDAVRQQVREAATAARTSFEQVLATKPTGGIFRSSHRAAYEAMTALLEGTKQAAAGAQKLQSSLTGQDRTGVIEAEARVVVATNAHVGEYNLTNGAWSRQMMRPYTEKAHEIARQGLELVELLDQHAKQA